MSNQRGQSAGHMAQWHAVWYKYIFDNTPEAPRTGNTQYIALVHIHAVQHFPHVIAVLYSIICLGTVAVRSRGRPGSSVVALTGKHPLI